VTAATSDVALYWLIVVAVVLGIMGLGSIAWKLAERALPADEPEGRIDAAGWAPGGTADVWILFSCGCQREARVPAAWLATGSFPIRCPVQRHRARVVTVTPSDQQGGQTDGHGNR
jgi:hypothetical protein